MSTKVARGSALQYVTVQRVTGTLSDLYDPEGGQLRLSEPVATGSSVAAVSVAAHEVAHAAQEAEGPASHWC